MTIKQQGGIFGRNPTFNDVTVDGDLSLAGNLSTDSIVSTTSGTVIGTASATAEGTLKLYDPDATFIIQDNTASEGSAFARMLIGESAAGGTTILDDCWQIAYDARYLTFSRIASSGVSGTPLEEFRVSSGVGIVMANGSGIDFSATSGTGTSELFDDYEEGTWTPVLSDANSGGNTATLGSSTAHYVKIGNVVHLFLQVINVNNSGMTGANTLYIQGLPYTSVSSNNSAGSAVFDRVSVSGFDAVTPAIGPNRDYMTLATTVTGAADANLTVAAFNNTASDIQNLTISYRA